MAQYISPTAEYDTKPSRWQKFLGASNEIFRHTVNPMLRGMALGFILIAGITGGIYGGYRYIYRLVNPDVQHFLSLTPQGSTKLYAKDGTLLYEIFKDVKQTYVPLRDINPYAVHATVAIEDKDFYIHKGISVPSMLRSAAMDYYLQDTQYGGSTITQQLVKNSILTSEKSIVRKVAEVIWAMEIEKNLSKDQILERYLNNIPYGRNTAGIEAAAKGYFGKSSRDLTLAESAYLAGLPQAPSLYSPSGENRDVLDGRKDYILSLMRDQGYITNEEYEQARNERVTFVQNVDIIRAPHFVFWLRQELIKQLGEEKVYKGGLKIETSLDLHLQTLAENTVKEFGEKNSKQYRANNAALVAIDPKTGQVLAMVGSRDYFGKAEPAGCKVGSDCMFEPNTNVATSLRQPGSSFKPYVYVTAFGEDFKFTPATIVQDIRRNFGSSAAPYIPNNYNYAQYGNVSVRKALGGSLNIAAVNTISKIGVEPVIGTLRNVGITAPLKNCGLALALGACEISLLEHTAGFAVFANIGKKNSATGIVRIRDPLGRIMIQDAPENEQVINPAAAYELVDIMSDNDARSYIFGKKNPLTLEGRKVAAKTGTTQNWKDGWTVGFTPELAVGVWTGNNDGRLMKAGADGVFVAAPIWNAFMTQALKDVPAGEFIEPFNVSRVAVDSRGRIVKPRSVKQRMEVMADYAIPVREIQPIKPRVLSAVEPSIPSDGDPNKDATIILEPFGNSVILNTPFEVKVYTGSSTIETSVDLYIDNKKIETKPSAPFLFVVPDQLKNGWHTIKAVATHFDQFQSETSIRVRTFFNPGPIAPRGAIAVVEEALQDKEKQP